MGYGDAMRRLTAAAAMAGLATLAACQQGSSESGGGGSSSAKVSGNAEHGKVVFATTCSTCHAADGTGVKGLGKDLVHSEFVQKSSDGELVQMVTAGRSANDPLNTTKIAMPAKGGNASLNDQDIADAVAYVRSIHKPS